MRIDLDVKIMKLDHCLIALGILVCVVAPVAAHHSMLAQSTADRVTVRGTIYAPAGNTAISGGNATVECGVVASTINVSGTGAS